MTSPYSTRHRNQLSHNQPLLLSKNISQPSTISTSGTSYIFENNQCSKIQVNEQAHLKTPEPPKKKVQVLTKVMSQQDFSNAQLHSSSIHEQSHLHRKNKRDIPKGELIEHYVLSMSYQQGHALSYQQLQKDSDKNIIKVESEMQNLNERKSYRKMNNLTCFGVPYRKCHSSMQQKVVSIINKLKSGKDCQREIETLMDRTKKVSTKELHNKFFVSGIQLLFNLSIEDSNKQLFHSDLKDKISFGLKNLKNRILQQLDNTKIFETKQIDHEENSDRKIQVVKRIYRILRKKLRGSKREEVQSRALEIANRFALNKYHNLQFLYEELASNQA